MYKHTCRSKSPNKHFLLGTHFPHFYILNLSIDMVSINHMIDVKVETNLWRKKVLTVE